MISDIAAYLAPTWGPLRLLTSSFLLAAIGTLVSALGAMILIPTLWKYLPTDRGRAHAVDRAHPGPDLQAGQGQSRCTPIRSRHLAVYLSP